MKKRYVWLLADLGMITVSLLAAVAVFLLLPRTLSTVINVAIGVVVFSLVNRFISNWYYSGISLEERFRGGDDE
jgi:predicted neutral ceramidase superfamily lipid hydrolase